MTISIWWIPSLSYFLLLDLSFVLNIYSLSYQLKGVHTFTYDNIVHHNVVA